MNKCEINVIVGQEGKDEIMGIQSILASVVIFSSICLSLCHAADVEVVPIKANEHQQTTVENAKDAVVWCFITWNDKADSEVTWGACLSKAVFENMINGTNKGMVELRYCFFRKEDQNILMRDFYKNYGDVTSTQYVKADRIIVIAPMSRQFVETEAKTIIEADEASEKLPPKKQDF